MWGEVERDVTNRHWHFWSVEDGERKASTRRKGVDKRSRRRGGRNCRAAQRMQSSKRNGTAGTVAVEKWIGERSGESDKRFDSLTPVHSVIAESSREAVVELGADVGYMMGGESGVR